MEKQALAGQAESRQGKGMPRRKFLASLGLSVSAAAAITACSKNDHDDNMPPAGSIDLGKDDIGILNYAYALEQLEAAFYGKVALSPYAGITPAETQLLTDIRDHEIAHREFFKKALGAKAIPSLEVNFASIDFSSREKVLAVAKTFEDLGVGAYNGAGKLISNVDYLLLAGKIVSVEARHAALIRDLISNGSFADDSVVNGNGLDVAINPADVLNAAKPFLKSVLWGGNLPKS